MRKLLLTILLASIPVWAEEGRAGSASEADWSKLGYIPVGARLEVETRDNKRHSGEFVSSSEEAISLRQRKRGVGYRREEVVRVSLLGPPKRRKAAQKGFIIGVIPGTVLGALVAAVSAEEDTTGGEMGGIVILEAGFWGGIGALIGAAAARPQRILVYRAPPPGGPEGGGSASAGSYPAGFGAGSFPAACASPPSAGVPVPAPLRGACGVFSTEQAGREVARELASSNR